MAIYKPTDVQPASVSFDVDVYTAATPIWFSCKIDTNNTVITAYSIEVYNESGNVIFPNSTITDVNDKITYISKLKKYIEERPSYKEYAKMYGKNVNTGINGTYLVIPFIGRSVESDTSYGSVTRNMIDIVSTPSRLFNGRSYTWKITLYQTEKPGEEIEYNIIENEYDSYDNVSSNKQLSSAISNDDGESDLFEVNDLIKIIDGEPSYITNFYSYEAFNSYNEFEEFLIECSKKDDERPVGKFFIVKKTVSGNDWTKQQHWADVDVYSLTNTYADPSEHPDDYEFPFIGYYDSADAAKNGHRFKFATYTDGSRKIDPIDACTFPYYLVYDKHDFYVGFGKYYLQVFGSEPTPEAALTIPPQNKYFDMIQTSGLVLGSTNNRFQSVKSDKIYKNYYVQPVRITSNGSLIDSNDVDSWKGLSLTDSNVENVTSRQQIIAYDSTYGYIYPNENKFFGNIIENKEANGFRIYKQGNDPENLTTQQKVSKFIDDITVPWDWKDSEVNPSESYGEWTIPALDTSSNTYTISSYTIGNGERVVLNHQFNGENVWDSEKRYNIGDIVRYDEKTYKCVSPISGGSTPSVSTNWTKIVGDEFEISEKESNHNGIFYLNITYSASDKTVENSAVEYKSGDYLYEPGGFVYYDRESTTGGVSTTTREYYKVIRYYYYYYPTDPKDLVPTYFQTASALDPAGYIKTLKWLRTPDADTWKELSNKVVYAASINGDYSGSNVQMKPVEFDTEYPSKYPILNEQKITFVPEIPEDIYSYGDSVTNTNKIANNTGLIFYNKPAVTGASPSNGLMYIRPFYGLSKEMRWKEQNGDRYCDISNLNTDYWRIEYEKLSDPNGVDGVASNQSVIPDKTRYQIVSYFKDSDENVFYTEKKPTIDFTINDTAASPDSTVTISSRYFNVSATYEQDSLKMWDSYKFKLYNSSGELVGESDYVYSGAIEHTFYGLQNGDYKLELTLYLENGGKISKEISIENTISETESDVDGIQCSYDCDLQSVEVELPSSIGDADYIYVFKKEIWRYGEESLYSLVYANEKTGTETIELKNVVDYNISNNRQYDYLINYKVDDVNYSKNIPIKTSSSWWSITELHETDDEGAYTSDVNDVWKFKYNIDPGEKRQELSKSQQETLAQFPVFSHGPKNAISGSVTCLIGRDVLPYDYSNKEYVPKYENGGYIWEEKGSVGRNTGGYVEKLDRLNGYKYQTSNESIDMINRWNDLCYSGNPKLLKDIKGNSYIIQITENSVRCEESWTKMPDTITFSWVQIDDPKKYRIINERYDYFEISVEIPNDPINVNLCIKKNNGALAYIYMDGMLQQIVQDVGEAQIPLTVSGGEHIIRVYSSDIELYTYVLGLPENGLYIKRTVIGKNIKAIGNSAFSDCYSLTSITIPDSVTSIGDYAFYECSSLTNITIGNGVTSIGSDAFCECSGLTSVTIGNGVTSIGDRAFYSCSGLTSIKIPNSVTSIGDYAFAGCSGLTSITIGNGVTSIGEGAFIDCDSLTSVTIPNSVTYIDSDAFYGCNSLTSITIGNSVTSIGSGAFSGCSKLESITIPEGVTSIGNYAFEGCSELTIYCEAASKPSGWDDNWNPDNRPVYWGSTPS